MTTKPKLIWSIGHSTRSLAEIISMLEINKIDVLVDVRSFPGSRRYPHFNKETLAINLPAEKIDYVHLLELGGRRKVDKNSPNTEWKHPAFRGYADYMETPAFENGIQQLQSLANVANVCYMCSEAVWWKCHRSMISDYLKANEWNVTHIMSDSVNTPHRYTKPANLQNGKLSYRPPMTPHT